jgi:chromosome segregation ATPase
MVMTTPPRLQAALKRLQSALDLLEAAGARRAQFEADRRDLDEEFVLMQDDRARLAVELDRAQTRADALDAAAHQAGIRLREAGAVIGAILDADEPAS